MEKLVAAGLYGGALVPLSGSLAKRYNECLALLGVAPTKLKTFTIDGMGWSPEISEEKKEVYYLNTGDANVNAIIISPEQEGKPLHAPFHSFDRDVLETVFKAYPREIRDITKDAALILHIDQQIDAFFEPFDLLRYDTIVVSFVLLNQLDKKQMEQEAFINLFHRDHNFIDREVHQQLITSAKKYGDLRGRKLRLDPIKLKITSFYTNAFGGVFVLKEGLQELLVFEDEKVFKKAINDTTHDVLLFHKYHTELLEVLVKQLLLEKDFKSAMRSPRYERIKKHLFSENLEKKEHPLAEILESHFLFKRYLNQLPVEIQKKISGAELYFQKSILDKTLQITDFVAQDYITLLHEPHSSLRDEEKELIWKLLVKIKPKDPVHLFWYDKSLFYQLYTTWDASYQDWVIKEIVENNKKYAI